MVSGLGKEQEVRICKQQAGSQGQDKGAACRRRSLDLTGSVSFSFAFLVLFIAQTLLGAAGHCKRLL